MTCPKALGEGQELGSRKDEGHGSTSTETEKDGNRTHKARPPTEKGAPGGPEAVGCRGDEAAPERCLGQRGARGQGGGLARLHTRHKGTQCSDGAHTRAGCAATCLPVAGGRGSGQHAPSSRAHPLAPGHQGWNPAKSTCVHPPLLQVFRGSDGAERVKAQAKGVTLRTTWHRAPRHWACRVAHLTTELQTRLPPPPEPL